MLWSEISYNWYWDKYWKQKLSSFLGFQDSLLYQLGFEWGTARWPIYIVPQYSWDWLYLVLVTKISGCQVIRSFLPFALSHWQRRREYWCSTHSKHTNKQILLGLQKYDFFNLSYKVQKKSRTMELYSKENLLLKIRKVYKIANVSNL